MSDWPTIRGSAGELLNEARAITGIDIIDEEARVPLSILLDSYNRETRFTEEGAVMKRSYANTEESIAYEARSSRPPRDFGY
jgi:hypothetical protein